MGVMPIPKLLHVVHHVYLLHFVRLSAPFVGRLIFRFGFPRRDEHIMLHVERYVKPQFV